MTDIVERLRRDLMEISYDDIEAMVREAAAEIERLTMALAAQTEQHEYPCSPHCAGYLREQAAQADNARLTAALQRIADDGKNCADHCRTQARRALEPKP